MNFKLLRSPSFLNFSLCTNQEEDEAQAASRKGPPLILFFFVLSVIQPIWSNEQILIRTYIIVLNFKIFNII